MDVFQDKVKRRRESGSGVLRAVSRPAVPRGVCFAASVCTTSISTLVVCKLMRALASGAEIPDLMISS